MSKEFDALLDDFRKAVSTYHSVMHSYGSLPHKRKEARARVQAADKAVLDFVEKLEKEHVPTIQFARSAEEAE